MRKIRGNIFVETPELFTEAHEDAFTEMMNNVLDANGFSLTSPLDFTKHIDDEVGEDLLEFNFTMKTKKEFIDSERFELDEAISDGLSDEGFKLYDTNYEIA